MHLLLLLTGCTTESTMNTSVLTELESSGPIEVEIVSAVGGGVVEIPIRLVDSYAMAIPGTALQVEVDGVGVVDGRSVDDAECIAKGRSVRILMEGSFDGAMKEPHEVAITLSQVPGVGRGRHQVGLIDGITGSL